LLSKILFVYFISPIRRRFFQYGPRASNAVATAPAKRKDARSEKNVTVGNPIAVILDHLAGYTVPHRWFIHFYTLSAILSAFWAYQIWHQGFLFRFVATNTSIGPSDSMSTDMTALVWALMLIQGVRRLFECIAFAKRSSSKMWIGHWILGLAFYACMSVAVWVEGSRTSIHFVQLVKYLTLNSCVDHKSSSLVQPSYIRRAHR